MDRTPSAQRVAYRHMTRMASRFTLGGKLPGQRVIFGIDRVLGRFVQVLDKWGTDDEEPTFDKDHLSSSAAVDLLNKYAKPGTTLEAIKDAIMLDLDPSAMGVKGIRASVHTASRKLDNALKQQVNKELRKWGFDGNGRFQRHGQIVSLAFNSLKKFGLTLTHTVTPSDFARPQGTLKWDIEFINEADPFSPEPVSNSILFVQYTKDENDMYEVVGYLS